MSAMEIEIEHLNTFYGKKQALHDITMTIPQGMFGLLGRNGAGKTTLMKTLVTLLTKESGTITLCGIPVEQVAKIRSIVGYLPQDFLVYPNMSVWEALDYLGILSEIPKSVRHKRMDLLLEKVNLTDLKKRKVRTLSGGEKRRLGIAQALLQDPRILIVDEPTAGLDPEERIHFRNLLSETAQNRIVILSTHIVGDVEAACENIAILKEGELLYYGTVTELVKQAKGHVYTATVSQENLTVVKERYPVTSQITKDSCYTLRFLSEEQPEIEAELCEPCMEDAYLYKLEKKAVPGGVAYAVSKGM